MKAGFSLIQFEIISNYLIIYHILVACLHFVYKKKRLASMDINFYCLKISDSLFKLKTLAWQ